MKDESTYKRFLLKKELDYLKTKKGFHTELITLMIPPDRKLSDVTNYLKNEINESSNIKSKLTRKNVIDSITSLLQKLKTIRDVPDTGLFMFSGAIPQGNTAGTEKNELYIVEPIEVVTNFKYHCSSEFYLEPLEEMLNEKQTYGIIVIDNKEVAIGWVRGSHIEIVKTSNSGIMGKHNAGGQSQRRFERLHDEAVQGFIRRSGELANEVFLPLQEQGVLEGIFIGGAGHTKYAFGDDGQLDYRIKDKILEFYDIGVGGAEGIRAVLIKAEDKIANVRYTKEKKLMEDFLFNLSRDTGMITYGEKEVRSALERGAVDTLLLSEALDYSRVTLICEQCQHTEEYTVKNSELKDFEDKMKMENCSQCQSSLYSIADVKDLRENLGELAENLGTNIEMISTETEGGETLISTFGGIAATLRYKI